MPFTAKQIELLRQLEFSEEQIATQLGQLNDDELSARIKQQKKKLVVKYHPDKTNGDDPLTKKFIAIMEAVDELLKPTQLGFDLLRTIRPFADALPLDCVDLRMKEQIDDYFDSMSHYVHSLSSKHEQQQFIDAHKTFLQFALWLEQHSNEIKAIRGEAFYRTVYEPSLFNTLKQNWYQLIIQFFAEEELNDIVYREAIALGKWDSILASRKLASPIKWLCFMVCSAYDAMTAVLGHWLQASIKDITRDLATLSSDKYRIVPLLLKMAGLISALALPIVLFPELTLFMFALPVLVRGLVYLANPINQVIRPLSAYFNLAPIGVGLVSTGMLVGALGGVLLLSGSMLEVLLVLTSVISILSLIASALFLTKVYEVAPELALILGTLVVSLTLLQFIPVDTQPAVETITSALIGLFSELSGLGLNVLGYQQLANMKENLSELYIRLPLPEQEAPEVVVQVIGEVCQKNYWSHSLFNSPLQPNVTTLHEKTSWHSMGLFGKQAKRSEPAEMLTWEVAPVT
ncbi:hypothetical protein ACD661_09770 [Legionella lytica]|uniref:J domain-containing protein n=1 Tax=Legionella lytica TaxID=96232 RepID=A0ABW8D807_9GAMM